MKRVLRTTMMALLVMVLCVGMLAPTAMAYTYEPVSEDIPVTIFMKSTVEGGELPESDDIEVTVVTLSEGSPDAVDASFVITTESADGAEGTTGTFTVGPYTKPGDHYYGVTIHTSDHEKIDGDVEIYYLLHIQVLNKDDYSGLRINPQARIADSSFNALDVENVKRSITDINFYVPPLNIKVVKKWAGSIGGEVKMDLIVYANAEDEKGTVVETARLNKENNWQHTFEDLDSRLLWDVKETKVPAGYWASYKADKTDPYNWIITVTNASALYQTGQLNWPIPVLICCGSVLMLAGILLLRKREETVNE